MNKDTGFSFEDISSSSTETALYEDIVSDTSKMSDSININSFVSDGSVYKKKKHRKLTIFDKIGDLWKGLTKPQKALAITVLTLFVLLCLFVIWTIIPFGIRGRLFGSAFGFMALNLLVYLCIKWKKRKTQTVIMSLVSVIMSAVMVLTLFFWIPFLQRIYNFDDDFTSDAELLAAVPAIDKDITNIALFGIDTRDTKSFSGNSDSIMILSLNAKTHKVKIISIMRDSLVPISSNGKTSYNKINSAYSRGGAELAVRTINSIFNLDITEYATVNFFGMAEIIDGVGGIEVPLTENEVKNKAGLNNINPCITEICYKMGVNPAGHYISKSGTQHLNGIQAVAYSRIRYVANAWGTNNDYGRTDRQRYVMEQLFNKALTLKKTEYPALIKALIPYARTSLGPDEILSFALTILGNSPTFEQMRMPQQEFLMSSPSGSFGSVVYYDLDYAADVIHAMIYDDISVEDYVEANGIEKDNWYARIAGYSSGSNKGTTTPSTNTTTPDTTTGNDNSDGEDDTDDNNNDTTGDDTTGDNGGDNTDDGETDDPVDGGDDTNDTDGDTTGGDNTDGGDGGDDDTSGDDGGADEDNNGGDTTPPPETGGEQQ